MDHATVPGRDAGPVADPFGYSRYTIRWPLVSFFEPTFRIFAPGERPVMFARPPVLNLRQQFDVCGVAEQALPLLSVRARQVIAIDHAYDVLDVRTNERVGTLVKKRLKSIVRDRFDVHDPIGHAIGTMEEKGHSFGRRFLSWLINEYDVEIGGQCVAHVQPAPRLFSKDLEVELDLAAGSIDPRLAVACALLAVGAAAKNRY